MVPPVLGRPSVSNSVSLPPSTQLTPTFSVTFLEECFVGSFPACVAGFEADDTALLAQLRVSRQHPSVSYIICAVLRIDYPIPDPTEKMPLW